MKSLLLSFLSFGSIFAFPSYSLDIGQMAPNFSLSNSNSKNLNLSDFKGKTVVLEWLNHGCPFVRKHYDSDNMQTLQKEFTKKGIVWLSIISSAPGKQGYSTPQKANQDYSENKAGSTHILLDPKGNVGRSYEAKTTPHMYIVNPKGKLVYKGAIDSIPSANQSDIPKAVNYVKEALDSLLVGKKVKTAKTRPYGCSVKY